MLTTQTSMLDGNIEDMDRGETLGTEDLRELRKSSSTMMVTAKEILDENPF